jgi:predicted porin
MYSRSGSAHAPNRGRGTLHGSVALAEHFRRGGVVLSFARSNDFSGIVSNGFHNRYDLAIHQEITPRLRCEVSASYVQQQMSNARNTNGELATANVRYMLNQNWSFFGQVRYLHITGSESLTGPAKSAIVGFRWSWVPEKP